MVEIAEYLAPIRGIALVEVFARAIACQRDAVANDDQNANLLEPRLSVMTSVSQGQ